MCKKIVVFVALSYFICLPIGRAEDQISKEEKEQETMLLVPVFGEPQVEESERGYEPRHLRGMIEEVEKYVLPLLRFDEVSVEKIVRYFREFNVEGIEVWISGMGKGGVPVLSIQANAGIKLILKPKKVESPTIPKE